MPTLTLKIAPAQGPARHAALAAALTRLTADVLGKRAAVTAVVVEAFSTSRWFVAGQEVQRAVAQLEITITAGTNSAAEKAAFVEAAHTELQRQLAPGGALEPASYVIVREIQASDWGYGGLTQAERRGRVPAPA